MFSLKKVQNERAKEPDDLLLLQQFAIKDRTDSANSNAVKPAVDVVDLKSPTREFEKIGSSHKNSFLEKNMIVIGPVSSVTNIEIQGQVTGDVSCENDVIVSGIVTGDISAGNVKIVSGLVKGNINSKSSIIIDKGSAVKGNITGELLKCDGKVEGNTILKTNAIITSNALMYGDISAKKIILEQGVEVKGSLMICENNCDYDKKTECQTETEEVLILEEKNA